MDTADLPTGHLTFLFTDVEGSTVLWDQQHDAMYVALAEHDELLRTVIEANGGHVFSIAGDSFGAAFSSPVQALDAAISVQIGLTQVASELKLRIRIGLHTGQASIRERNYFGIEVNRAARIMGAAHGGQVLLSQTTLDAAGSIETLDMGQHLLKDLPRPEQMYQLLHPDLGTQFPPLKVLPEAPSDLPEPLTRFVGRTRELSELDRLLSNNRLITLTGTGGAGKTRLALQIASDAHYQFPDGLRIVELAGVTEAEVLVDEVAQVFAVQPAADTPIVETLVATIGAQRSLLILDNCEQLVAPVKALVTRLLADCRNLKILCTSREIIDVPSEVMYRVPSLAIPDSDVELHDVADYDAITLFMDRALSSNASFEITQTNLPAVVAICTRLDGIPLALELAAARLRAMSPSQIAERLDERFLSVAAESAAGTRHHTLQNTIDWSYNLLGTPERKLFQRLGGFTGDFTLEAVEQICGAEPLHETDLIELTVSLIDKSMVTPEPGSDGLTRYRLLESLRIYGAGKLDQAGELHELLVRHLDHYAEFCEQLQAMRRGGQLGDALAALDDNEDNIRAALRYGLQHGHFHQVARIIGAVGYLWYAGGLYREGSEWCSELFDAQPDLPDDIWAAVLHAYGTLLGSWAQPRVGAQMLEQEVELRRRLADPARLAAALNNLGNLQHDIGRFDEAEATLREAIVEFRAAGESPTLALTSLGSGYLHAGELATAEALYAEALEEAAAAQDAYGVALATGYLGQSIALQGNLDQGRELLDEARTRFEALTVTPGVANADFHLALIDRAQGHRSDAARRLLAALSAPEAHWYLATQYWILQTVASILADDERAAVLLGVAKAHYDRSQELQPAYVLEDFAATTELLYSRAATDVDASLTKGRRLAPHDAIALALAELAVISSSTDSHV